MVRKKLCGVSPTEVAGEDWEGDLREVHQHQRIERFTKRRIDVETNQPRIQFPVLAEQHGHAFAVRFSALNEAVRFVNGPRDEHGGRWRGADARRVKGRDELAKLRREVMLLEKRHQQLV